jgi:4-amino-4-deoxy-L-arabinose transferase-like glycosyltransferase
VTVTEPRPGVDRRTRAWLIARWPIIVLLLATAVIYLTAIARNGMGNDFYAASAWAGSHDWKALLFGSLDPGNSITVDKPPLSQWVMGLSGRIFGFSSASMLIPQALMGVLSVGLMYGAVRRLGGEAAGLIAGTALALTPVAALMFRFNNPDAAMVTMMVVAAYCTVRALQGTRAARWMVLAGLALGFAFLAKMLEGLLVAPAIGLTYLVAAPVDLKRRILHGVGAIAGLVVGSGWYVLLTILWPAASRPYLAGSTDNTFMNLVLGYNGFGRVTGQNHHGGNQKQMQECFTALGELMKRHGGHGGFGGGQTGFARLFSGEWGLEVGFLLPAAIVALIALLVLRARAPRTDPVRAGAILFGLWMVVDGALLAEMKQAVHAYYSLSMVPGIVGLIGLGLTEAWRRRESWSGRIALAAQLAAAGIWAFVLLSREPHYAVPLRWIVLVATVVVVIGALVPQLSRLPRPVTVVGVLLGALVVFGGSAAYVWSAIAHAQTGGNPTVSTDSSGFGHGRGGWGSGDTNTDLQSLLTATNTHWAAAINGSSQAAGLELATGKSVIAVGGFTGQDPSPSLEQLQDYVKNHRVSYYIVANRGRLGGSGDDAIAIPAPCLDFMRGQNGATSALTAWVTANFPSKQVGGDTVYDLTVASHSAAE